MASPWSCPASCFSGMVQPGYISLAGQDLPPALLDRNRLVQQGWVTTIRLLHVRQAGAAAPGQESKRVTFLSHGMPATGYRQLVAIP